MRLIHGFLLLALIASTARADQTQNGNMWLKLSESQKLFYTVGFLDGMTYGSPENQISPQMKKFSEVTPKQIMDGFDKIYTDYRNRLIPMLTAMDVVIESIKGESDANTEIHLEWLRKKISKYIEQHPQ
jgi:hypothetical protein